MKRLNIGLLAVLTVLLTYFGTAAQQRGDACDPAKGLGGVYRIDVEASDRLYSVIEEASSTVPFAEQQQFFIDLAVRLTPPDLLAIECRGGRVSLASSRARRVEFQADGVMRSTRTSDGRSMRTRIRLESERLTFTSGGGGDSLSFSFTPLEAGRRLRVTRRISATELIEPVVINTVYEKIGDVARWDIFEEGRPNRADMAQNSNRPDNSLRRRSVTAPSETADALRIALDEWIAATNERDINRQMSFYAPRMQAFYLSRNAPLAAVRAEKNRAFAGARSIDIRAAEPEIIFQDGGQTAVMRFRKKYRMTGARNRSGEVVQELRWRKTTQGWRIYSERDIRVIR